jgi:PIN domain nuclease of toxin-antitoxin system
LRLLLDTHFVVWLTLAPDLLTQSERACLETADAPPVLSAVAIWELRLKWHRFHASGGRKGPVGPATPVAFGAAVGWEFLPLTLRHAAAVLKDPLEHKDPFDELLLVQAQEEGLPC